MTNAYYELADVQVGYNGKAIIKDINLSIDKGEIVTLIGPNGAGKSTILKSITRHLQLIGGKVTFQQKDVHKMSFAELSKHLAVVLTERMKPELMTCYDIVSTGRYPYTGKLGILSEDDHRIVHESMEAVHAADLAERSFDAISDGQRQRILLARAFAQEPDIIVLDEPTSFLDIRYKLELLAILRDMAKRRGITVIMSLHEIDLAMKVSDKVVCVKGDRIYRVGSPDEVFDEAMIGELYSIEQGSFDALFGSIELPRVTGTPRALVVSNGGTGGRVYRILQKRNVPFAAAVLFENDIDYQLARLLAAEVVSEKPFAELSEAALNRALELVESCDCVIDAGTTIGPANAPLQTVLDAAQHAGKLTNDVRLLDSMDALDVSDAVDTLETPNVEGVSAE